MDRPTHLIEYEGMLLGRYAHLSARGGQRPGGLERSAYILLSRIRMQGPMSLGQLSEAFGLDVSTLHRQTAAMRREGLVERIADPDGGMARKFRITAEGARRLDRQRADIVAGIDQVVEDWTAEEVAAFAAFLKRFNAGIERRSGRPWPRPADGPSASG
ncbi:MarR family transcriptional regulator [Frankia sp. AgB1.9]|uniref:MarR family winged helix-turn-helix transcriptional regulator n=1 Tax=unclassified Frankia TaxID=2632575 RepID=UPI0019333E31|nr:MULTISPECIES: MarR family transcriptional regulator [unclassified Frankia]MBL7488349.1 MarR family transcriptional regulator [Frankia sp. AgW1.1]MBL7548496.1 MarR family transcriptional regulator [Frankia sp. AgB1.9]MBL7619607.1 MarR family transcriptional regulator [Frankia sp. AgB1.8]